MNTSPDRWMVDDFVLSATDNFADEIPTMRFNF